VVAIGLGVASPAWAAPSRDAAAAEQLFDQGRAAIVRKDWTAACTAFEQSQGLDPATGTLLNLGECRYQLGRLASAWQDFVEALRELPAGDPRRDYAQGRVTELEKKLPKLVVTLKGDAPAGTRIVKNGVEMPSATLGIELAVDPGAVTLTVTAPGRTDAQFTVDARPGEVARIDVAPGAERAPASEAGASGTRTIGFVVGGVGIAGVVTGAVTGALALSQASDYRSDCPSGLCASKATLANANSASSSASTLAAVSTVGFIAGAAGIGAGLYLVLRQPSGARPASSASSTSSTVGVSPTNGGAAAVWRATF
jgi:tetratricopeptide (TPR) repeat protein